MSHPLELLILETVQLGGSLVFLADQAPSDFHDWTLSLSQNFVGEIPFVTRRVQDLISRKFATQPEDLVIFFSGQMNLLTSLDPVLSGQRVLFADGAPNVATASKDSWDFIFEAVNLPAWNESLEQLKAQWGQAAILQGLPGEHASPCLFLDRDDVVVKNVPYNKEAQAVVLMPGICEVINQAHAKGYWVALVTNQSGLGRGWISWQEYQAVHQRMLELLAQGGAWIDDCEWSAFIEEAGTTRGRLLASLRKPRNGMLLKVNNKLRVHMAKSVMVGDSASDLKAAFAAGLSKLFLLASDKTDKEVKSLQAYQSQNPSFDFVVLNSLSELTL